MTYFQAFVEVLHFVTFQNDDDGLRKHKHNIDWKIANTHAN